jgi:rubrerythrin
MDTKEKKSIVGTQTEKNLMTAFAGESQARNRYTYYASIAKEEGYEQISAIFIETADNEKEHAKRFFKFLEGNPVEITATFPTSIGTTLENLHSAAEGEHEEWDIIYPKFAQIAEEEGFKDIADAFKFIAAAEKRHDERFVRLLNSVDNNKVFKRTIDVEWKCRNCGYIHYGKAAPDTCPACAHPQKYFEIHTENY